MTNTSGGTTPKKNEPPKKIQVGPLRLDIEFIDDVAQKVSKTPVSEDPSYDSSTTYGCLSFKDQTIYLATNQKEDIIADTLLHEVLHAIWSTVGGWAYPEADEERIVSMLTGTLLDTLRRNRELTRYLFDND